jgi:maleylacetate reductase
MSLAFNYQTSPAQIIFGPRGVSKVPQAAAELGCDRLLVLSGPQHKQAASQLATSLGELCVGVYANATMHTPVEVTNDAMQQVAEYQADGVLSLGGGSTIGLGKAIAYRSDLPQIVIPTTYAGSEVTPILGQTENGAKTTLRSPKVLPEVVIYDAQMTHSLPKSMSITSGINAIAHAVEALYAQDKNPVSSMMAVEGATALIEALPIIADDQQHSAAREKALYGSWLCGTVLGNVGMALHHKLCHTLGGLFNLPHADTHTVLLPHATAYNAKQVPDLLAPIAHALQVNDAGTGLFEFAKRLGAPTSLKELGMQESGIDQAVQQAMANPYWNPRELEQNEIRSLISHAFHGHAPT